MNFFKRKYVVWFMTKEKGNTYTFHRSMRIRADTTQIDISRKENKTIAINTEIPSFTKGLTSIFIVDILQDNIVYFADSEKPVFDAKYYNKIAKQHFFLDATSNLEKDSNSLIMIFNLLIGVIIGAPIGILFGYFLFGGLFPLQMT